MNELLDKFSFLITLVTSVIFCIASINIARQEDKKYTLTKKEKYAAIIISIISSILINIMNPNVVFLTLFLMTSVIAILSVSLIIDIKMQELPDRLTLLSFFVSLIFVFIANRSNLVVTIGTMLVIVFCLFLLCYFIGGIGFGDVKLLVPVLFFIPPVYIMSYWLNTIGIALIVALFLFFKTKDKHLKFAFGPFIIIGLISVFCHLILI